MAYSNTGGPYNMQPVSTPYRDIPNAGSNPDLQDYYDESGIPPPHRLSGIHAHSPFDSTNDVSQTAGQTAPVSAPFLQANQANYSAMPTAAARSYENLDAPPNNQWLEKQPQSQGSRRAKWIVAGSLIGLAALIAIGVALGVTLSKKHSSNSSAPSGTNPNTPNNFPKNNALIQSFYGLAYTPLGSQLPDCGNSIDEVIEDIQLMSQLTTRIRLYGADCNQSSLVLSAIQQTQVNMSVYLGNYPSATDNGTAYERQRGEIQVALQNYGANNVAGVTVGNEFVLDYVTGQGQSDPNGPAGDEAAAMLIPWINDTRSMLADLNLGKTIPVGNSDAGSYFNTKVLEAVDYGMSNVHPWFANQSIQDAAGWTADFFNTTNVQPAALLANDPKMYIAETGWPTDTSELNANPNDGPSIASAGNLQIFLNTFVCAANANSTGYFFFEFSDEPWKATEYGGVEGYWGLFNSNKTLKPINIPNCNTTST